MAFRPISPLFHQPSHLQGLVGKSVTASAYAEGIKQDVDKPATNAVNRFVGPDAMMQIQQRLGLQPVMTRIDRGIIDILSPDNDLGPDPKSSEAEHKVDTKK